MRSGTRRGGAAWAASAAGLALFPLLSAVPVGAQATGWAPKVSAVYKLRMAGMELATFNFTSTVTGDSYTLAGHGKMTWGLGLFKYNGNFSGAGHISGETVAPASYAYDWRVNKQSGSVRIAYGPGGVKSHELVPPNSPGPDVVPLQAEHLKGVLDPLTALIVLSRHRGAGSPCDRKLGVFEGKQRFDIQLTPLREEKVAEIKPSGQPASAHVCRVKYTPISGHKMNRETKAAIKAEGIEVALRPIPSANLAVPYRIVIPTPLGNAVMTAQQVEITGPGNVLIALAH